MIGMRAPAVRILDIDFNLKGEVDDYESLKFTRRFYRSGEFELDIAIGKQDVDQLQKERIIMINNQTHKTGIIMHRQITTGDDGIERLMVRGPTLGGILDRRITVTEDYDRVRGKAETVMKHYIWNHLINSPYQDRNIPFMAIAPDQQRGIHTPWQTRFEPLDLVMEEIAKWCDIGWLVCLDVPNKKWVFDVLEGRDLTVNQSVLPPVIFSHEFDNIQSQEYVDSDLQYKNVGYAGGPGDEYNRLIQIVGSGTGFDRREVFLDCSSAEDAQELIDLGEQALSEHKRITTYNGRVLDTHSFQYEKDWDLGDRVTIQNKKWGLILNSRVTEVTEIYEPTSMIEVKFGDEIPTITKIAKRANEKLKRRS